MITASCHCGQVKLEIDSVLPDSFLSCNCTICRRYGNLMAYYNPGQVTVSAGDGAMARYVWGDKMLAFMRCANCGCFMYTLSLTEEHKDRMGVNARMFDNVDVTAHRIRHFDGADTWTFLD